MATLNACSGELNEFSTVLRSAMAVPLVRRHRQGAAAAHGSTPGFLGLNVTTRRALCRSRHLTRRSAASAGVKTHGEPGSRDGNCFRSQTLSVLPEVCSEWASSSAVTIPSLCITPWRKKTLLKRTRVHQGALMSPRARCVSGRSGCGGSPTGGRRQGRRRGWPARRCCGLRRHPWRESGRRCR